MPQVGANVRAARTEAGLTQEQLARALNVTLGAVQSWERGERIPQPRNLDALCCLLDRHPSWFYAEHEPDSQRVA